MMELDFSALFDTPAQSAPGATGSGRDSFADLTILNGEEPATGHTERQSGEEIPLQLIYEKEERERTREAYKDYQDNIKRAGNLRAEILLGIKQGEDPLDLLLKALECIGNMTGDGALLKNGRDSLITIYGRGLDNKRALALELEDAEKRLALLLRPELITQETKPAEKSRILWAREAHQALVQDLRDKLEAQDQEPAPTDKSG